MNETKKCKQCQAEIDKKANICPNCKKRQGGKLKFVLAGLVLLILAGVFFSGIEETPLKESVQDVSSSQDNDNINGNKSTDAVEPDPTPTPVKKAQSYLSDDEVSFLYTNVDEYIGRKVKLAGKIFAEPEIDKNAVYFQMFQNPTDSTNNTVVAYAGETKLSSGDYVLIDGEILSKFEGENAFGGSVTAPVIEAANVTVVSYADAVAPANKTIELNESRVQNGYEIILEKVEFANEETRLYITINNDGKASFSAYPFNMKLIQDKKQYEEQGNWEAEYPELQTDLYPDTTTNGIVCFPPINQDSNFSLYVDAYSDNYDEKIKEFKFEVTIK